MAYFRVQVSDAHAKATKHATERARAMATINTPDEAFDYLTDYGIATEDELVLVSTINGHSVETYESVLFARTGYRTFEQISDES
jgi:hypothetical protein